MAGVKVQRMVMHQRVATLFTRRYVMSATSAVRTLELSIQLVDQKLPTAKSD
jgi:hypothetical protein